MSRKPGEEGEAGQFRTYVASRAKDFFHVEAHPHLRFDLSGLSAGTGQTHTVTGTLHIRGNELPINAPLTVTPEGPDALRLEADFDIDHRASGFEFKRLPRRAQLRARLTLERMS